MAANVHKVGQRAFTLTLYDMREILDRVLIHLSTIHAFPDDYHLIKQW
jgi:hypothetical protein